MKINKLYLPVSMTAALVGLIACVPGCAKKNNNVDNPLPAPPEPLPTNAAAADTLPPVTAITNNSITVTNVTAPADLTNSPPPEATINAPAANLSETNLPGHNTVVEMPTTIPAMPTNFYSANFTNTTSLTPIGTGNCTNFFLRFRAGYEHINHGDNNDAYTLGAKLYAYGDGLREQAGKNGWLIPDASVEISSQYLPKTDQNPHPGSDNGLRLRADFTWPWFHWTSLMLARENSVCPFCRPLTLALGPTVNIGFDHLYNETDFRFAHYAGVRLTFNRAGFIEYTAGGTEGLDGTRQQVVAEIPFYESRDGEVRYYLRGLWNRGAHNRPDILEGGIFLEMPFSTLISPGKWGDLVPFEK